MQSTTAPQQSVAAQLGINLAAQPTTQLRTMPAANAPNVSAEAKKMMAALGIIEPVEVRVEVQAQPANPTALPTTRPPTVRPSYIDPPWLDRVAFYMEVGKPVRLVGPAAAGKSLAVQVLAERVGADLFSIAFDKETTKYDILGSISVKSAADGGGTGFCENILVQSVRKAIANPGKPVWFNVEEINAAPPGSYIMLNTGLDGTRTLFLENGDTVKIPDNWRFICSMNDGYTGTLEGNPALMKSRCVTIECDVLPADIESSVLFNDHQAYLSKQGVDFIVQLAAGVRESRKEAAHEFDLCLRTLDQVALEFFRMTARAGMPATPDTLAQAFLLIVLPKIGAAELYGDKRDATTTAVQQLVAKADADGLAVSPSVPTTHTYSDTGGGGAGSDSSSDAVGSNA